MTKKIIIYVSGGVVQGVSANGEAQDVEVFLNDTDHDESESDGGEARVAALQEFMGDEEFKDIF